FSDAAPRRAARTRGPGRRIGRLGDTGEMTDDNLSRAEAQERARTVSNLSYDLALDLTTGEETFRSETTASFFTPLTGLNTFVDLDAAAVKEMSFNGRAIDPSAYDADRSRIPLRGSRPTNEL